MEVQEPLPVEINEQSIVLKKGVVKSQDKLQVHKYKNWQAEQNPKNTKKCLHFREHRWSTCHEETKSVQHKRRGHGIFAGRDDDHNRRKHRNDRNWDSFDETQSVRQTIKCVNEAIVQNGKGKVQFSRF